MSNVCGFCHKNPFIDIEYSTAQEILNFLGDYFIYKKVNVLDGKGDIKGKTLYKIEFEDSIIRGIKPYKVALYALETFYKHREISIKLLKDCEINLSISLVKRERSGNCKIFYVVSLKI